MKTSGLYTSGLADDGECLSFHSLPAGAAPYRVSGFEILLLPEGIYRFTLAGEGLELRGPQLLLLGPQLERGWTAATARNAVDDVTTGRTATDDGTTGRAMVDDGTTGRAATADIKTARAADEGTAADCAPSETLAIRWPADLLGDRFLDKNHVKMIGELLAKASLGVCFPAAKVAGLDEQIAGLRQRSGFAQVLTLLAILHQLSLADGQALLSAVPPPPRPVAGKKSPMDEAMDFMQTHYFLPMTLEEMARKACMTKGSFCRSFRKRTGQTYAERLNEIRLSHICQLLVETNDTVSEIAYRAGYQNIFHFHRHFKRQKGCTPKEFREGYRVPVR